MRCNSCSMEWSDNEKFNKITECPFCKSRLSYRRKVECDSTMEDILKYIMNIYGEDIFKNKSRLINIFKDLAPTLKKEIRILEFVMNVNVEKYFIGVSKKNRKNKMQALRSEIEPILSFEAVELVINSFSEAFGWNDDYSFTGEANNSLNFDKNLNLKQTEIKNDYTIKNNISVDKNSNINISQSDIPYIDCLELAKQGDADAQLKLAYMYEKGIQVNQSYIEARKWYAKAAEQGNQIARYNLASMYKNIL